MRGGLVVEHLELSGGGARGEREQHGSARGWLQVEEEEEAAAVPGVGDDTAEEGGLVPPEGHVEEEGDLGRG